MIEQNPTKQNFLLHFASHHQLPHVNKSNLHSYSPYMYDYEKDYYVVDEQWYNSLIETTRNDLNLKYKIGEIKTLEFPHEVNKAYEYWEIYTWYNCEIYDFSKYIEDISTINNEEIYLVKFANEIQKAEFSEIFFKENPKIQNLERLNKELQEILKKQNQNGYFIKLSQRSGKNQIKLFPAKNLMDIYKNLIYSNDVKKQIYGSSGILLRQWKQFSEALEFRVHIFNRRILAISLQYFKQSIDYKKINFGLFIKQLEQKIKIVKFANSYVLDVMFVNNQYLWFLQFNPYGVYSASRSAIFTHEQLLSLEKQKQIPIIKILRK